jgi:hypothetical protein
MISAKNTSVKTKNPDEDRDLPLLRAFEGERLHIGAQHSYTVLAWNVHSEPPNELRKQPMPPIRWRQKDDPFSSRPGMSDVLDALIRMPQI